MSNEVAWLMFGLGACGACGGSATTTTTTTTTTSADPAQVAVPDEPTAEALPLLTAHPAPPPIAVAGCHERNDAGEVGDVVQGLEFQVSFVAGRNRFHQGEVVQLALSFASRLPDTHQLDAGTYDRGGRLHADRYGLEPTEGVVDPLADYFERGPMDMGGIRHMPMLEATPTVIERDLNEYLQVRRPGTYQLRVDTSRVSMPGKQIVCGSQALELEIVPLDETAAAATLREVLRVLERNTTATDDEKQAAARRLRFVPTEDAAIAMVRLLASQHETSSHLSFGLFGSPHRTAILEAMTTALTHPRIAVSTHFFDTLRRLSAQHEQPGYLPPWPENPGMQARWRSTQAAFLAHRTDVADRFATRLLESLANKRGDASDVTFATLLETAFQGAERPSWMGALRPQIGNRLPSMDPAAQSRFLSDRWRQVADVSLVPALLAIADGDETEPRSRSLALARLVELAPTRAIPRIHGEIRRVPLRMPDFAARDAFVLPPGPIAALDESLAAGIERNDHEQDIRAHLLARHGSVTLLPRVRTALARRRQRGSSAYEGAMLNYLLRVDHDQAVRDLATRWRTTSASPSDMERSVFAAHLASAAEYGWDASIETHLRALLATHGTGQAGSNAVVTAARTLGKHGEAASERLLWSRLEAHHRQYRGRDEAQTGEPWQIEDALVTALLRGRSWHLDRPRLQRLLDLTLTESSRANVQGQLRSPEEAPLTLTVFLGHSGDITAHLGPYHFASSVEPLQPLHGAARRHFVLAGDRAPAPSTRRNRSTRRVSARALDGIVHKLGQLPRDSEVQVAVLPIDAETRALQRLLIRWMNSHRLRGSVAPS